MGMSLVRHRRHGNYDIINIMLLCQMIDSREVIFLRMMNFQVYLLLPPPLQELVK